MNRNLMRQAQELQQRLQKLQDELNDAKVEATSGGGVVKVIVSGKLKVQSIEINPDVVDPADVEMLQDLVLTAVNEGLEMAQELANTRFSPDNT